MAHTLTLRLLATHYGPERFRSQIASYLLEHERRRNAQSSQLNTELARMVRARMELEITKVDPLTGGYSDDDVYAVEFSYNFPLSDGRGSPIVAYQAPAPRLIVKRSSRDSFIRASQNYSRLPAETRSLFVRQPAEEQIYRSQETGHHFLIMEDLTDLLTLHRLLRRWDYGQVSGPNERLLGARGRAYLRRFLRHAGERVAGPSRVPHDADLAAVSRADRGGADARHALGARALAQEPGARRLPGE